MQDRKVVPVFSQAMTSSTNTPPNPIRNRWALLVGVNRYSEDFSRLKFCVNDVKALAKVLTQLGYTVVCMHDELDRDDDRFPTRNNVEAELTKLCQLVGSDDLLWVHFACHGTLVDQKPVLIAQDTRHPTLDKSVLPLSKVETLMRGSKAKRLVLTLDACHTGVEIGRELADPEFFKNACELAEGFALIAASTAQQVAREWQEVEHGVFTYYMLKGLTGEADQNNRGFVTVNDLQTYVVDQLKRWNGEHKGRLQEPTYRADGRGDFMLGDYRQGAKPEWVAPLPKPVNDQNRADVGSTRNETLPQSKRTGLEIDRKQLRETLLNAFPDEPDLEMMLLDEMSIRLNTVVGNGTYRQKVFKLVQYAESQGRLEELVRAAHQANPGNVQLRRTAEGLK